MPKPRKSPRSCSFKRSQTKSGKMRSQCTSSKKRYTSRRCSISSANRCVVSRLSSKLRASARRSMSKKSMSRSQSATIPLVSDMQLEVLKPVSGSVLAAMSSNLKNLAPAASLATGKSGSIKKKSASSRLYILKKHKARKSPASGLRAPNASMM